MHFGFALELSDIDLWNIDLLDTHLDLLFPDKYTNIPSKYFVCLQNIFNTSSRHVFKTSSRLVQRNNFTSSKTSSRRLCKMSSRCLQDVLEDVKLLRWRRLQDQQMFAGFIEITVRHGCSAVILLHIFRTPFPRNTFGWLLLNKCYSHSTFDIFWRNSHSGARA